MLDEGSPAASARSCEAAGSTAMPQGIQITSRWGSAQGRRKFGEKYSHLCTEIVPDKQVLTRSYEQAEEREMPPAFIFMSFCNFYV